MLFSTAVDNLLGAVGRAAGCGWRVEWGESILEDWRDDVWWSKKNRRLIFYCTQWWHVKLGWIGYRYFLLMGIERLVDYGGAWGWWSLILCHGNILDHVDFFIVAFWFVNNDIFVFCVFRPQYPPPDSQIIKRRGCRYVQKGTKADSSNLACSNKQPISLMHINSIRCHNIQLTIRCCIHCVRFVTLHDVLPEYCKFTFACCCVGWVLLRILTEGLLLLAVCKARYFSIQTA